MADSKNNEPVPNSGSTPPSESPESKKEKQAQQSSSKDRLNYQNKTLEHSSGSHPETKTHRTTNVSEVRTFYTDRNTASRSAQRTVNPNTLDNTGEREGDSANQPHPLYQVYIGIASILLIILGIIVLGFLGLEKTQAPNNLSQQKTVNPPSILYTEKTRNVPQAASPQTTVDRINAVKDKTRLAQDSILSIYLTKNKGAQLLSSQEFLRTLAPTEPLPVTQYLRSDFQHGFYAGESGKVPFVIFQIADYENMYTTMISIEPRLQKIFSPLFGATTQKGEVSSGNTESKNSKSFNNKVIRNQDVRVSSQTGNSRILYSFPNRDTLVITTTKEALIEIFDRLNRAK